MIAECFGGERHMDAGDVQAERGDAVNASAVHHPAHYNQHPSGVECIDIVEHYNFNLGNAIKYIWRAGLKSEDAIQDLEKASWYCHREIQRLRKQADANPGLSLSRSPTEI